MEKSKWKAIQMESELRQGALKALTFIKEMYQVAQQQQQQQNL